MTVPSVATYSSAALVAASTDFKDLIDAGASAGSIKIRDSADVLLAQIPLTDPCGTVHGTTGQLTITPSGPDTSANATGTAAYGEICDSDGLVHLALPVQAGSTPTSGKLVMNTLSIVAAASVEIVSVTIG